MRKLLFSVLILIALSLTACGGGSSSVPNNPPPPPPPVQGGMTTVDFGASHQTIRGFGGSDAWIGLSGSAEANALFGTGPAKSV